MKTLAQILGGCAAPGEKIPALALPGNVVCDSRKATQNSLFVAVRGVHADGHDFIPVAVANGAKIVVHEKELPPIPGVEMVHVADAAAAYSLLVRANCGDPDEAVAVCGVTGTNGKTSTVYCIRRFLEAANRRCGMISTVEVFDGKDAKEASGTTPDAAALFDALREMKTNEVPFAAMELSSHALDQRRTAGLKIRTAIFTNLTGDHLDYHRTMEDYFQAKKKLFFELLVPGGVAIVNGDDPWGRRLLGELRGVRRTVSFGAREDSDCRIDDVAMDFSGSRFSLRTGGGTLEISTKLVGMHNIRNLTGALLAAREFGVPDGTLVSASASEIPIPGRLERFDLPSGAAAFVDYAHTDDALRNVLSILRRLASGKLIAVFGAGGDRDRTKRPRMGKAVAEYADEIYATSDNPRSEDPEAILDEVVSGIPAGKIFARIADRRAAILTALGAAGKGDVVLIAGKGHENYQEIRGVRHFFSDAGIVREFGGRR